MPRSVTAREATIHDAKGDIFRAMAAIGQAFSSPPRLQMLGLLAHSPRTVEQLAEMTAQSNASASSHLKVLRAAGLVETEKVGRHRRCRLASPSVGALFLALQSLGRELLPEVRELVERFFDDPESLSPLTAPELAAELEAGRIRVVDLRPPEEFAAGHIPGAVSLPFPEIAARSAELAADGEIAAYCRGPYCLMAVNGTSQLRRLGLPVRRLTFSLPEWRAAGLPVEL
ncbi:MAG: metalloregulator ArsR/SmtB family transcription factor [Verrucomicrobiaceae bacterium]|nr:metalloregulator ArsR/SmtB family transcription factor [Verrucomicrobiaceae bacterium]